MSDRVECRVLTWHIKSVTKQAASDVQLASAESCPVEIVCGMSGKESLENVLSWCHAGLKSLVCMQRLWFVLPWLTDRYTDRQTDSVWPAILLAQPSQLKIRRWVLPESWLLWHWHVTTKVPKSQLRWENIITHRTDSKTNSTSISHTHTHTYRERERERERE